MSAPRPTLLLLPGLLNDAQLWQAQRVALANVAECEVGDITQGESMRALATQVLAQMPPRFALAGFSLGGYVAQDILRIAPERVERLALLDTSARADSPERVAQRRAQEASVRGGKTFLGFGERLMRHYVHPSRWQDAALLERVRGMTQRLGVEVFVRQNRLEREDGRALLRAYTGPLLVLCGQDDTITPPTLHEEMAALAVQAQLVQVPACGHLSPLEQPQAVSDALREWLLA
ncbi:alpha/beta fold hydrolase [Xanthomonas hortorum]|uniref:2-succinyl-6-hydroxy-2,4-cyclohexadiene-1-carboxy late synthase n=1 Tax=Xanthomonas hortorum pv. gardneri TaxID=2754056 RepID=A0A6V7BL73_9XANT|nr:alpha/beta fold hydrolase [Xanthomonas hortorum]MCC4624034.1 alpha/beta hydrolase [Xanthomonas campestris pv. nigromaculans]APP78454.1 alpha/beta hydrolase [Xanthomonas hortorum pv. gardneri]EGD19587.1 putative hydrolase or acyltransferase of alpha/beta superfamily [Xanthomonas hortorum ATCC 19865]KLA97328.1 alpha/beta hydrolase [Xanthomonas hortorum pv. gardneri]KLA97818.1 alpha/beta hydrolase [Xanthomonas hortorum pv. gardneri]